VVCPIPPPKTLSLSLVAALGGVCQGGVGAPRVESQMDSVAQQWVALRRAREDRGLRWMWL